MSDLNSIVFKKRSVYRRVVDFFLLGKEKRATEEWIYKRICDSKARQKIKNTFKCVHCNNRLNPDVCDMCPMPSTHIVYITPYVSKLDSNRHYFIRCQHHTLGCKDFWEDDKCFHIGSCKYTKSTKEDCIVY